MKELFKSLVYLVLYSLTKKDDTKMVSESIESRFSLKNKENK
jgi:hypothetical protein